VTLGFGVLGWLSGSGNVSFRLRRAQRDAQKGVEDMNYKTVLKRAQREPVILFDTEEGNERAWMVPQLSLILDLLNYWAFTENLADIRYAAPHPDGAAKALEILEDPVYANRVLEAKIAEDEKDFTVSRMVTQIYGKILQRMTKDSESDESARGMITLGRTGISGWDWLELNDKLAWSVPRRRTVQREHKLLQPDLNPSWMPLAQVIPIFMGQCEGELMAPIRASEEVCRRWYPMPGGLITASLWLTSVAAIWLTTSARATTMTSVGAYRYLSTSTWCGASRTGPSFNRVGPVWLQGTIHRPAPNNHSLLWI